MTTLMMVCAASRSRAFRWRGCCEPPGPAVDVLAEERRRLANVRTARLSSERQTMKMQMDDGGDDEDNEA
jgi:hypothetical protein